MYVKYNILFSCIHLLFCSVSFDRVSDINFTLNTNESVSMCSCTVRKITVFLNFSVTSKFWWWLLYLLLWCVIFGKWLPYLVPVSWDFLIGRHYCCFLWSVLNRIASNLYCQVQEQAWIRFVHIAHVCFMVEAISVFQWDCGDRDFNPRYYLSVELKWTPLQKIKLEYLVVWLSEKLFNIIAACRS